MLSCARNTRIFPKNNPKEENFPLSGHGLNELLKCMAIQRLRRFQSAGDAGRKNSSGFMRHKAVKTSGDDGPVHVDSASHLGPFREVRSRIVAQHSG